jgi:uncharacterized surface protein with fasciclin (FAS1) repeats
MIARRATPFMVLAAFAVAMPLSAQDPPPPPPPPPPEQQEMQQGLVQALEAQGNFSTFVNAIRTAGLEEQLSGDGQYTVFAPTDEAFAKLPEGKLEELMADPEALKELVSLHIVQESIPATAITEEAKTVNTLQGSGIEVKREGESVRITAAGAAQEVIPGQEKPAAAGPSAMVTQPDLATASNGVIHAVDTVLLATEG